MEKAYEDVRALLPLPDKPWFTKVLRPESGIPQLEMNHPALLAWRDGFQQRNGDIHLCGFGWEGIGMNDMTKAAKKIARAIIAGDTITADSPQKIKPVYF